MRKIWKQRLATTLIVAMTAGATLTSFGEVGKPSEDTADVTVTFNGNGGYWDTDEVATSSVATPSKGARSIKATATASNITRIFTDLEQDDEGNYYAAFNNYIFDEEDSDAGIPEPMLDDDDGRSFVGWYYNLGQDGTIYVDDDTPIYSDVTLKAGWAVDDQVNDYTYLDVKAVGMSDTDTLAIDYNDDYNQADVSALTKSLGLNLVDGRWEAYEFTAGSTSGKYSGNKATITMEIPVSLDEEQDIAVIHVKDGTAEQIPSEVSNGMITFTANSFSPYIFVNYVPDCVVKIENVPNGYVEAYVSEYDYESGETTYMYLPIGEDVILPKGTEISLDPTNYDRDEEHDGFFKCDSLEAQYEDGTSEIVKNQWSNNTYGGLFEIEQDTTFKATFVYYEVEDDVAGTKYNPYIQIRPNTLEGVATFSGNAILKTYDEASKKYVKIENFEARLATVEDSEYDNELFEYDAASKKITSKDVLKVGVYNVLFVINQGDEEFTDVANIHVGNEFATALGLVTFNGEFGGIYNGAVETCDETRRIGDVKKKVWGDVAEFYSSEFVNVGLYGYEQDGWQTYKMKKYEPTSSIEAMSSTNGYYYGGYMRMVDEGNELYKGVEAIIDYNDPIIPPEDPKDDPTYSGHRYNGGGSDNTNTTALTGGRWIRSADGRWWYPYNAGSFAADGWKYLMWNNLTKWYFFDAQGWMMTGWIDWNGNRYYLHPISDGTQGYMYTGWQTIDGVEYYFQADGALLINGTAPDGQKTNAQGAKVQ